MRLRTSIGLGVGKATHRSLRLLGKNAGALPGLMTERIAPRVLDDMLRTLPDGVIVVTGTNGKTTTTKIITDILTANGKRVLTNRMGSNFTRGVVSVIVKESSARGQLPHDIAVLELDEAYAKKFAQVHQPRYVVALNVMRDQLDRFGEIDTTARLIIATMRGASEGVIVNANDPRLAAAAADMPAQYFAVDEQLLGHFPSDDDLLARGQEAATPQATVEPIVTLQDFTEQHVTYMFSSGESVSAELQLTGQYNFQNGAAALALLRQLLPDVPPATLVSQLAEVKPAFGRGETLEIHGQQVELVLIKNPSGFRLALASFTSPADTLIAINDHDPDGRDVSWLWDIDFADLAGSSLLATSGRRAYDMALRLQYSDLPVTWVESDVTAAADKLLAQRSDKPKRIFCNYTAMLAVRKHFGKELHDV